MQSNDASTLATNPIAVGSTKGLKGGTKSGRADDHGHRCWKEFEFVVLLS